MLGSSLTCQYILLVILSCMCTIYDVLHNLPCQSVIVVFYSSEFCYGYEKQLFFNSLNIKCSLKKIFPLFLHKHDFTSIVLVTTLLCLTSSSVNYCLKSLHSCACRCQPPSPFPLPLKLFASLCYGRTFCAYVGNLGVLHMISQLQSKRQNKNYQCTLHLAK